MSTQGNVTFLNWKEYLEGSHQLRLINSHVGIIPSWVFLSGERGKEPSNTAYIYIKKLALELSPDASIHVLIVGRNRRDRDGCPFVSVVGPTARFSGPTTTRPSRYERAAEGA